MFLTASKQSACSFLWPMHLYFLDQIMEKCVGFQWLSYYLCTQCKVGDKVCWRLAWKWLQVGSSFWRHLKKKAWLASETSRTASGLSGLTQDEKLSMPLILIDGPSKWPRCNLELLLYSGIVLIFHANCDLRSLAWALRWFSFVLFSILNSIYFSILSKNHVC